MMEASASLKLDESTLNSVEPNIYNLVFKCKECEMTFPKMESVQAHYDESHAKVLSSFDKGLDISRPVTLSSEKEAPSQDLEQQLFLCSECNVFFKSKDLCSRHLAQAHHLIDFDFEISLDEVGKETRTPMVDSSIIESDLSLVVPKKFQPAKDTQFYACSFCTINFEAIQICQFHEGSHDVNDKKSSRNFICRICQGSSQQTVSFPCWSKCSWHLWKTHGIDCELASCSEPECRFKSFFAHKVREHERIHTPQHSFRCATCHKGFKQLKQLRTHEKYHLSKETRLPPPLDSRWYTTKECHICQKILSDSKCLKKHIAAVHKKLKPHSCNICGHQSARKAELQLHMRQHTGEKCYSCDVCPFTTGDHNSLRRHKMRHSPEKRKYKCGLCSFTSIQSGGLKKHVLGVHGNEDGGSSSVFPCPFCSLVTINNEIFNQHIKDHDQGRIPREQTSTLIDPPTGSGTETKKSFSRDESSSRWRIRNGNESIYWAREEETIDLVDTGGITIPAQQSNVSA